MSATIGSDCPAVRAARDEVAAAEEEMGQTGLTDRWQRATDALGYALHGEKCDGWWDEETEQHVHPKEDET